MITVLRRKKKTRVSALQDQFHAAVAGAAFGGGVVGEGPGVGMVGDDDAVRHAVEERDQVPRPVRASEANPGSSNRWRTAPWRSFERLVFL